MKTKKSILVTMAMAAVLLFSQCKKEPVEEPAASILPSKFKVDIPNSISSTSNKSLKTVDALDGNEIYGLLPVFINVGEGAADIVQNIMFAIAVHNINHAMSISFTGDDDGRVKNLVVIEGSTYEGQSYEFEMTISDAESVGNADGGKAIQVLWNRNPVQGIAVLKPYNMNRNESELGENAIFRIDYSEAGELGYDSHMFVSISGLPVKSPLEDPYSISTLKMFAGKSGDYVDVRGNTNHPNASFFDSTDTGFNWAFVATGHETLDIGVAELGLPPSTSTASDRATLLETYSIKQVFTTKIYATWPAIDSADVAAYLVNTDPPGFFNNNGFVVGGTSPGSQYDIPVSRISTLIPFVPNDVSSLNVEFKP